jgi:hypothetical protein
MGRGRAKAKQTKVARDLKYTHKRWILIVLPKNYMARIHQISLAMMTIHLLRVITYPVLNPSA